MRDINDTNANPIAGWVAKQIERGFKGFELYARGSAAATLVDRYPADPSPAEVICSPPGMSREASHRRAQPPRFTVPWNRRSNRGTPSIATAPAS